MSAAFLQACAVGYAYPGERASVRALDRVDVTVGEGELVGLIGRNGSGKTTLAKHFNGLLRPDSGIVRVRGADIASDSIGAVARRVGYVFQNPDHQIFSATVRDEVATGPRNLGLEEAAVTARVSETLDRFDLLAHADRPPAMLGFGLRRKVALAGVIAMRTPALILDEPTAGLDARNAARLMEIVHELHASGHTIVVITHDMDLVAHHLPRSIVMADGRVRADGDTRAILDDDEVLRDAHLEPPQLTALARGLGDLGFARTVVGVGEFCDEYARVRSARTAGQGG